MFVVYAEDLSFTSTFVFINVFIVQPEQITSITEVAPVVKGKERFCLIFKCDIYMTTMYEKYSWTCDTDTDIIIVKVCFKL